MSRIMKIVCDWCGSDITYQEYQTMTFRRYAGVNHEKVYRLPTMWMCDKCYKKLALKMSFPPYEGEDEQMDDLISRQAVKHLDLFAKTYCRDKSVKDDLVFRCNQCDFQLHDRTCLVKTMARKLCPDFRDFGAIGGL